MGFEQLASLRDELAQQATLEKLSNKKTNTEARSSKNYSKVEPSVLVIGQLQKTFPLVFPKNPAPKIPLKIGIHTDLFEHADQLTISQDQLRAAIKVWCTGNRYWECVVENANRVDLNALAVGQVTKAEAISAKKMKWAQKKINKASKHPHPVV